MTFIKPTFKPSEIKKGGTMTGEEAQKLVDEGTSFKEIHKMHGPTVSCSICNEEYQEQMLEKMGYKHVIEDKS